MFDFDHTVIDGNTDEKIQEVHPDHGIVYSAKIGWTEYMRLIFVECERVGVKRGVMEGVIRQLPFSEGMEDLFKFIRANRQQIKVVIASDSNTWFISVLLERLRIADLVDHVFTNPAHWDKTLLVIDRYETNESCSRCPINMCKQGIIRDKVKTTYPGQAVIYCGDGSNDYCPLKNLSASDVACPRVGYRLEKLIDKQEKLVKQERSDHELCCRIVRWQSGEQIQTIVKEYLSK